MAESIQVGPAFLCLNATDPDTAGDWVVTFAQEVDINFGLRVAFRRGAFIDAELASAGVSFPAAPTCQLTLVESRIELMKEFIVSGAITTDGTFDGLAAPSALSFIDESVLPTVAIIPLKQAADGEDAVDGFWLPKAFIQSPNGLGFTRPEDGSDPAKRYNVPVQGVLDDSVSGDHRAGFFGPPGSFSLAWALPTLDPASVG